MEPMGSSGKASWRRGALEELVSQSGTKEESRKSKPQETTAESPSLNLDLGVQPQLHATAEWLGKEEPPEVEN